MKTKLTKAISLVLTALVLVVTVGVIVSAAGASDYDKLAVQAQPVVLAGDKGTAEAYLVGEAGLTFYLLDGSWSATEVSGTNYFTFTKIEAPGLTIVEDEGNFLDQQARRISWMSLDAQPLAANTNLVKATYTVASNTPDGEYTIRFTSDLFAGSDAEAIETPKSFEVKVSVTHICSKYVETQAEKPATCGAQGWKEHYKCTHCGTFYSDQACTDKIENLYTWKNGDGMIPVLPHDWAATTYTTITEETPNATATRICKNNVAHQETETVSVKKEVTTQPTCTTKGETTYTATFTETWAKTQTKTLTNVPALDHAWGEPTYTDNEDGTHTANYVCGNDASHTKSDDPVEHSYTNGECVCGAEEPVEILYGDADGDGEITLQDANLVIQYISDYDVTLNVITADADGDGEITLQDANLVIQYISDYDVTLGPA